MRTNFLKRQPFVTSMKKSGANIKTVSHRGVFEILIRNSEILLSHATAYVFVADADDITFTNPTIKKVHTDGLVTTDNLAHDFTSIFQGIADPRTIALDKFEISI